MDVGPTIGERITDAYIAMVLGLVAFALYAVVIIVLWRQGRRGPILLSLTGLGAITVGVSATGVVRLVGLTRSTDTFDLALGIQFGATAIALALLSIALVSHRRRTSVR